MCLCWLRLSIYKENNGNLIALSKKRCPNIQIKPNLNMKCLEKIKIKTEMYLI